MIFSLIISLLGLVFLLINCVLFYTLSKNKHVLYKIIMLYLTLLLLIESVCNYIGFLYPNSNFFLSHYYFVFQFLFLSLFFYNLFAHRYLKNAVLFLLILELSILGFQYYTKPSIYWYFNNFEIGSTSALLILYSAIYLIINLKKGMHPYYYFCAGLIIYLSSSSLIFLSGNTELVFFKEPFFVDIWILNSLFYILYQFLIFKEWNYLKNNCDEIIESRVA